MKKEQVTTQEQIYMMFARQREMEEITKNYLLECIRKGEVADVIETPLELQNAIKLVPQILIVLSKEQLHLLDGFTLNLFEMDCLKKNMHIGTKIAHAGGFYTIFIKKEAEPFIIERGF